MLRRHDEFENGTAWSNSSESSDDSSSPRLPVGGLHNSTPHKVTQKHDFNTVSGAVIVLSRPYVFIIYQGWLCELHVNYYFSYLRLCICFASAFHHAAATSCL